MYCEDHRSCNGSDPLVWLALAQIPPSQDQQQIFSAKDNSNPFDQTLEIQVNRVVDPSQSKQQEIWGVATYNISSNT